MRLRTVLLLMAVISALSPVAAQTKAVGKGWMEIGYAELLDGREPTHSGEAVSGLLRRLGGQPLPVGDEIGTRPDDFLSHILLDPVLERYAFVLQDALDRIAPPAAGSLPWYELAGLWQPGEAEPAWVELLRARRYLVESDGHGKVRVCLPLSPNSGPATLDGTAASSKAWDDHWPVLRHVLASERARLAQVEPGMDRPLDVEIHAYRHLPARSVFQLAIPGITRKVAATTPDAGRPSVDFDAWNRFLASGRTLEGARLMPDGSIRFLSSESKQPATLLGEPLTLADMAVAYRAIFHGGLGDPYMSLDRGFTPQTTHVNYGGRLRDTRLGMVALLCDIRFKTFSVGMDIWKGEDIREAIRQVLPSFMTHVERFGADPGASGVMSQQTRMWFYPDSVDMTLSSEGDVLVLRSVRMSAASERLNEAGLAAGGDQADPPWTRTTVKTVNDQYDALAALFPELSDLDQVVRLLSFFTWLKVARGDGLAVPDLDALLAVEIPSFPTPRKFPQMLAFNALPPAGAGGAAEVHGRLEVGSGLDRLFSADGRPLPARMRYDRAVATLDDRMVEDRSLRQELDRYDPEALDDASLDFFSYKAERIRMHRLVLSTLPQDRSASLIRRGQAGEQLRLFSVGIGGLDLGMGKVFRKATGRTMGFGAAGRADGQVRTVRKPGATPPFRAAEPPAVPARSLGDGDSRFEETKPRDKLPGVRHLVQAAESQDVRSRTLVLQGEGDIAFRRYEKHRRIEYHLERFGSELTVRVSAPEPVRAVAAEPVRPPAGILVMRLDGGADPARLGVVMRNQGERSMRADLPRELFRQLVLGPRVDPRRRPTVPGLWPPSPQLGEVARLLLLQDRSRTLPPWQEGPSPLPGEEEPLTVAGAMVHWAAANGNAEHRFPAVAVGTSADAAARWNSANPPGSSPVLLAPNGAFPGLARTHAPDIRSAYTAGPVLDALPAGYEGGLVLIASAEPDGLLAARLRALARDPGMRGRAILVWTMGGALRQDLAGSLLAEGQLAAVGIITSPPVEWRQVAIELKSISDAFANGSPARLDDLPVPALWFY